MSIPVCYKQLLCSCVCGAVEECLHNAVHASRKRIHIVSKSAQLPEETSEGRGRGGLGINEHLLSVTNSHFIQSCPASKAGTCTDSPIGQASFNSESD
eukprot:517023-Pelagomonas_calceolata.AAC.3